VLRAGQQPGASTVPAMSAVTVCASWPVRRPSPNGQDRPTSRCTAPVVQVRMRMVGSDYGNPTYPVPRVELTTSTGRWKWLPTGVRPFVAMPIRRGRGGDYQVAQAIGALLMDQDRHRRRWQSYRTSCCSARNRSVPGRSGDRRRRVVEAWTDWWNDEKRYAAARSYGTAELTHGAPSYGPGGPARTLFAAPASSCPECADRDPHSRTERRQVFWCPTCQT